ncbi:MAG: class I SAM-dependent methyltransferase [Chloroflexi bacterium]|nr:MAG: class I SAM-dependent methyltransferase [Chloroflexota bacterium]
MSTLSSENGQDKNSYIIDVESPAELARLLHQDRLFTKALGLLPPLANSAKLQNILDLACGPGGWTREAAMTFPSAQVRGIDISERVIAFAQSQAEIQQIPNVHFSVMDAKKPLNFPDNSFDLVHGRLLNGFLTQADWSILLRESYRILRPGGIICLTEADWGISNGPISERLSVLMTQAMHLAKHGISPSAFGTTVMLQPFLRKAGYQNIHAQALSLEYSAGTEAHHPAYQNIIAMYQLVQPFLISMVGVTGEELNRLYQQLPAEMLSNDFCGMWFFLRAWGERPQEE